MKIFDWKYIGISVVLLIGFVLSHVFYNQVLYFTKCVLSLPNLNLYAGGVSTIFTILHKVKGRKIEFKKLMSIKEFSANVGDVISFIDNPIIIVGSLTLVKGLFFQITEDIIFIPLHGIDLTFILIVTIYLLYSSILELWTTIYGTVMKNVVSLDTPHATLTTEVQNLTVPEPLNTND